MTDEITIRKATIEDAPYIFDMLSDMAVILREEKYLVNTQEQYLSDWDKGLYECVVAVDASNVPVGYIAFSYFYLSWQGKAIYLDDLYVLESHRRLDIGTKLMDFLFELAKDGKYKCVRWYVLKENAAAIDFYKKYNVSFEENRYRCNYFVSIE